MQAEILFGPDQTIKYRLILLDVFTALLSIVKMNEHISEIVFEFERFFVLQLRHPVLLLLTKLVWVQVLLRLGS